MITTYSNIKPPSRSASLISCLRNAPYLLASCYTFCLNLRQSSWGLCRVQVVIIWNPLANKIINIKDVIFNEEELFSGNIKALKADCLHVQLDKL